MTAASDVKIKTISCSEAIRQALDEAMAADESVVILGEDVGDEAGGGVFKCTQGLSTKYGSRVRSTPISEAAIVGAAIGASIAGLRPVAEIMLMNFLHLAMDQICNHAAKLRYMSGGQTHVPLTIRTSTVGPGAAGQHSETLEAWFCHTPGIKVVMPSNPVDAKGLLLSCIEDEDPCLFIENPRITSKMIVPSPGVRVPLGSASIRRPGRDVSVITYGQVIEQVERVCVALEAEGIGVELIDLRTLVPWDQQTVLHSVAKTGRAVIVHTAVKAFGVGAEISSRIHEELFGELKAPVGRVGAKFTPVPFNPTLSAGYLFNDLEISDAIRKTLVR